MRFSDYVSRRDEGLVQGIKGIWNIVKGGKYSQDDAKSAMNTSNVIANAPDAVNFGGKVLDAIRSAGLTAGVALGGGDVDYKVPPSVPIIKAYVPLIRKDPVDIYRIAKSKREEERYAKALAFAKLKKKNQDLGFIDDTPSIE
jgi:hypothetical protein